MKRYTCSVADNVNFSREDFKRLQPLVDVTYIFSKDAIPSKENELIENIGNAQVAILDTLVPLTSKVEKKCLNLKLIVRSGTSSEGLSQSLLRSKKLLVANIGDYSSESTAEYAFALILTYLRQVHTANNYAKLRGYNVFAIQGVELAGKKLGIIGAGNVGSALIPIAKGFGLNLRVYTKNPSERRATKLRLERFSSLEEVLKESDIIVCAVRLDPKEYYGKKFLLGKRELQMMKESAILVSISDSLNTIDICSLYDLILSKRIAGAAIDLQPPLLEWKFGRKGRGFVVLPNVLVTPNIAFNTPEAIKRKNELTIDIIENFVKGKKIKVLNYK